MSIKSLFKAFCFAVFANLFTIGNLSAATYDCHLDDSWHHAVIESEKAWQIETGSPEVAVGLIETGLNTTAAITKQYFENVLWENKAEINGEAGVDDDGNGYVDDFHGWDFAERDNTLANPSQEHGDKMGGVIIGMAPEIRLMVIKDYPDSRSTTVTMDGMAALAVEMIHYAVDNGARVINVSWGWQKGDMSAQNISDMAAAVEYANAHDVLIVAGAGNNFGTNNDVTPFYPASFASENVISVANTTSSDALYMTSNYGLNSVDVAAPAVDIKTVSPFNYPAHDTGSCKTSGGTSSAAAVVTGLAALLYSQDPSRTSAEVKSIILSTVDKVTGLAGKVKTGGRINAYKALSYDQTVKYSLTVDVDGHGRVVSTPEGIDCHDEACKAAFVEETVVTLTAEADQGYTFTGWSGACSGESFNCSVAIDEIKTVTATFEEQVQEKFMLIVERRGEGYGWVETTPYDLTCPVSEMRCVGEYDKGEVVELVAKTIAGNYFAGWGGACSGDGDICRITMEEAKNVTITFEKNQPEEYELTVERTGNGDGVVIATPNNLECINSGMSCYGDYIEGEIVTLIATAGTGSYFTGWSGACSGDSKSCEVIMDKAKTVRAGFSEEIITVPEYDLSVIAKGVAQAAISGDFGTELTDFVLSVKDGEAVTFTAEKESGDYQFESWQGCDSVSEEECTVTVSGDKTVTVSYVAKVVDEGASEEGEIEGINEEGGDEGVDEEGAIEGSEEGAVEGVEEEGISESEEHEGSGDSEGKGGSGSNSLMLLLGMMIFLLAKNKRSGLVYASNMPTQNFEHP